jgi:hypothetical protein
MLSGVIVSRLKETWRWACGFQLNSLQTKNGNTLRCVICLDYKKCCPSFFLDVKSCCCNFGIKLISLVALYAVSFVVVCTINHWFLYFMCCEDLPVHGGMLCINFRFFFYKKRACCYEFFWLVILYLWVILVFFFPICFKHCKTMTSTGTP